MKKSIAILQKYDFLQCYIISLVLNLIIEMFNRKSIFAGFVHLYKNPVIFLYNAFIIAAVLSFAYLFKRRSFVFCLFSVIWLILGIANFVVLINRSTPLAAIDFAILRSSVDIITVYVSSWQFFTYIGLIVSGTVILFFVYKKSKNLERKWYKSLSVVSVYCAICLGLTLMFLKTGVLPPKFDNLPKAYKKYGFVYCFMDTVVDHGVDKPANYSQIGAEYAINELLKIKDSSPDLKPNIIFLQLESFVDPNEFNFLEFSENPVPNITTIQKENASGKMIVPMVGAGTSNIEFEIMTGMSLEYFGAAEYPYKTILQKVCCESIAYNLKEHGYRTTAIHNHTGSFYDRNIVFGNLGYDCYHSVEYIHNVTRNKIRWAEDSILTNEIMLALNSSKERDFIYTISVQAHGKYPTEEIEYNKYIDVYPVGEVEDLIKYDYYVNQIYEVDRFVGELYEQIKAFDEPTVMVIYGDHLPALDLENEDMASGSIYNSAYSIVANYELPEVLTKDKDLYTYELASHVCGGLGFTNGIINKLYLSNFDVYKEKKYLELLEYDMLYGDNVSSKLYKAYEPTEIQMGIGKIRITGISESEEGTLIRGENFTKYTEVYVNNRHLSERFINNEELLLKHKYLNDGDILVIKQVAGDRTVLSEIAPYNVYRQTESLFEVRRRD